MIVTKKSLPRRTFLRGMGVTMALPFLDAMMPALSARQNGCGAVRRMGSSTFEWDDPADVGARYNGRGFELSPILTRCPCAKHLVVLSGWPHGGRLTRLATAITHVPPQSG